MLARLPRAFRDDAEKGFRVLSRIPSEKFEEIIQRAIVMVESRRPPIDGLRASLGLSASDISSVFAAAMLMIPFVGEGVTTAEFSDAATTAKLIDSEFVAKLKTFFDAFVAQAKPVAEAIKRSSVSDQVLPSFYEMDIAVDMRLAFSGDKVDIAVPVAVLHVDTDAEDRQIWFQCSKQQLAFIRDDIDDALKKMELAESWARREPKP
jgi:hypothetical protein